MADDASGKGRQTTQQPTINRSIGGAMTLAKAAAMVMVMAEARAGAWWQQHWRRLRQRWRQQRAVGHHPVAIIDSGGKDVIATTAINRHCSPQ
jgi:hypothetical protein